MSDWDPELYLRFMKERTQPVHDLISRIEIERPKRIIDIGCGPGNSTRVLKDRWPSVEIIGLDRSEAMIEKARKDCTDIKFILGNAAGDLSHLGRFDIVFANASLQWIPDHKSLIPRLFDMVSSKGVFAAQIPQFNRMPISDVIKNVVSSPKWSSFVGGVEEGYNFSSDESYYDYLSGRSNKIHMWTTDYYHVMNDHDGIMEMISSTGLKPFLDVLPNELISDFSESVLERVRSAYPTQGDGKVLFPFKRFFIIASNG